MEQDIYQRDIEEEIPHPDGTAALIEEVARKVFNS